MTVIIAYRQPDGSAWYMTADGRAGDGDSRVYSDRSVKAVQMGSHLVGVAGRGRLADLILYHLELRDLALRSANAVVTDAVPRMRALLSEHDFLSRDKDVPFTFSSVLIATGSGLYVICNDFAVVQKDEPWAAVGSGADVALAYVQGRCHGGPIHDHPAFMRHAVHCASRYDIWCGPPVTELCAGRETR